MLLLSSCNCHSIALPAAVEIFLVHCIRFFYLVRLKIQFVKYIDIKDLLFLLLYKST